MLAETEVLLLDLEKRLQFSAVPIRDWLTEVVNMARFSRLPFLKDALTFLSLMDLETAWQKALNGVSGYATEDVAALRLLGVHLGKSDSGTQLQCIREAVRRISENKTAATEQAQKAQKLYVGLGTCAGMALALLLI